MFTIFSPIFSRFFNVHNFQPDIVRRSGGYEGRGMEVQATHFSGSRNDQTWEEPQLHSHHH